MRGTSARGFTLLEVVVALAILAVVLASLPQVLLQAAEASAAARRTALGSLLASEKLEQLRGLGWGFDAAGTRVEDSQSDVTLSPAVPTGGVGLSFSPGDTLDADVGGFVDYLDAEGRWLAGGSSAPARTAFTRRWSVTPLADGPVDTLLLRVRVLFGPASGGGGSQREIVRLATLKSRRPM